MPNIIESIESERGCGYRRKGGIYLVSGGIARPCGKLPIPLTVCPTCSCGIKPSRGWTWVDADALGKGKGCGMPEECDFCPLGGDMGRAGLLWIGEKFYKTPGDFTREGIAKGISRRIHQVPKDFKIGDTWVLLAHRKTIPAKMGGASAPTEDDTLLPGIFHAFLPTRIEYIVKETETQEELEALEKRGFTLVKVIRDDGKPTLFPGENDDDNDEE